MKAYIVPQVYRTEQLIGKRKGQKYRTEVVVKDPSTISADDDTVFLSTNAFSRMLGYYFLECTTYGFHEFQKNVKGVSTVP